MRFASSYLRAQAAALLVKAEHYLKWAIAMERAGATDAAACLLEEAVDYEREANETFALAAS